MDGEVLLVVITSLCSGGVVCLIELWANSIRRRKEEKYRYRKEITQKYGALLYNIYRIFHVAMEPLLTFRIGEVDMDGLIEESNNVYRLMLELDSYYVIYKDVLDKEEVIEEGHKQLRKWIFETIKPAIDGGDDEEIKDVFFKLYNEMQDIIQKMARTLVKRVIKYYEN